MRFFRLWIWCISTNGFIDLESPMKAKPSSSTIDRKYNFAHDIGLCLTFSTANYCSFSWPFIKFILIDFVCNELNLMAPINKICLGSLLITFITYIIFNTCFHILCSLIHIIQKKCSVFYLNNEDDAQVDKLAKENNEPAI